MKEETEVTIEDIEKFEKCPYLLIGLKFKVTFAEDQFGKEYNELTIFKYIDNYILKGFFKVTHLRVVVRNNKKIDRYLNNFDLELGKIIDWLCRNIKNNIAKITMRKVNLIEL